MSLCKCDAGGGNTGRPSCFGVFDVTKKAILVEYRNSAGDVNGIDISSLTNGILDQAYLDARIKDVDPKTRWYPTPELKNVTDERDEDITEEFEDSSSVFIQEGQRSFEGLILKGDPVLVGNMKSWRCVNMGVFFIDKSGQLIGKVTRDGFLDPIQVSDQTFSVGLIKTTDTTIQKASVKFRVSQLEDDADLRMLDNATADLLGAEGLIDVTAETPTNVSTTGFEVQLNTNYGGLTSLVAAEGMEAGDFSIFNESTSLAVVITSVTESPSIPGHYTFVIPAQTSTDVLAISNPTVGPLDKSYDLTQFTVTIP
jgi:hypothetical protein